VRTSFGWKVAPAALCGLLLASIPPAGLSQTLSETFATASAAFEREQYSVALAGFEAARTAGMQGPAIEYNIAVCHYKLGQYVLAEAAFADIAGRYPAMRHLASYNRGLALLKLDREVAAREAFEQARSSADSSISALASAMLNRVSGEVQNAARPREWFKLIDLAVGHDDNVALLEQANLPAGLSTDSPYMELLAQLSGPSSASSPWRLDASAYFVKYSDASAFDQNALRLGATHRFDWRGWRVESGPFLSRTSLDGDGFERRLGASLRMRRPIAEALDLTLLAGYEDIDDLESRFAFVAGSRVFARAGLHRPTEAGSWSFDYRYESNDRAAATVAPERHGLSVLYRRRLSSGWSGEAGYAYRSSRYEDLATPRDEDWSSVSVTVIRELASGWQLLLRHESSDNDSNDALYAYDRQRLAVSIGKVF